MSTLGDTALSYAARGLPVFPVHTVVDGRCSCDEDDCQHPGKHPWIAHGHTEASTTEGVVRSWWIQHPSARIGMNTGAAGHVVIDLDDETAYAEFSAKYGDAVLDTATVKTPRGWHLHYLAGSYRVQSTNDSAKLKLPENVHVKAEGGYVIMPESFNGSGTYTWAPGHGLDAIRELPAELAHIAYSVAGSAPVRKRRRETPAEEKITEGSRNDALTRYAGKLRRDGASNEEMLAALKARNRQRCRPPLADREVEAIAGSVAKYEPAPGLDAPVEDLSDTGNANVFIRLKGTRVRYIGDEWWVYDGRRWQQDVTRLAEALVAEALLTRFDEAALAADQETSKKTATWAASSRSAAKRRAALEAARSDRRVAARPEDLDRDLLAFNCLNGTLDLRTGRLRPHDPADLITKLAPVEYVPGARSDLWERVLVEATNGDTEFVAALQRIAGYILTGDTREEVFFLFYGREATMKSTFLEALAATMGDYAMAVDPETFLARTLVGGAKDGIAGMEGARLAECAEFDRDRAMAEAQLKQLTGGDTVRARHLYQREREFRFTAKIAFHTNHVPRLSDDDGAVWRRAWVVPFEHSIPEERRDATVKARLCDPAESGAAILAWAVEGCREWQQQGLGKPPMIAQATRDVRLSMDPLADFFEECCVFEPRVWTPTKALRDTYAAWEGRDRRLTLTHKEWATRLAARGLEPQKSRGERGWVGVRLADADAVQLSTE